MGELSGDRFAEIHVQTASALHCWLETNHGQRDAVWLVRYKKHVTDRYVSHDAILDELIAYGWCDGIRRRVDAERSIQLVSPRRTQPWARSYKDRAERLITEARMQPAGLASITAAKDSGMWDAMNDVDDLVVPDDLRAALAMAPPAVRTFDGFSASTRRNILRWIASAKTPQTRQKRITATAEEAQRGSAVRSHG